LCCKQRKEKKRKEIQTFAKQSTMTFINKEEDCANESFLIGDFKTHIIAPRDVVIIPLYTLCEVPCANGSLEI